MPQLANIVVKKFDGTTDVTYTGISPASGTSPAVWKSQSVGTAPAQNPELRVVSRDADKGRNREVRATFLYPDYRTDSNFNPSKFAEISGSCTIKWSKEALNTVRQEGVYQFCNLLAAALVKQMMNEGYSAT